MLRFFDFFFNSSTGHPPTRDPLPGTPVPDPPSAGPPKILRFFFPIPPLFSICHPSLSHDSPRTPNVHILGALTFSRSGPPTLRPPLPSSGCPPDLHFFCFGPLRSSFLSCCSFFLCSFNCFFFCLTKSMFFFVFFVHKKLFFFGFFSFF